MKKTLIAVVSTVLICCCVFGGTLAWLTDSTDPIKNTFTVGNVDITLTETTTTYKMVPGNDIDKDPKVTVEGGSERCWLFVKIEESANLDDFITYSVADGWTELSAGIYYRDVAAADSDQVFNVLAGDKVSVLDAVEKDAMDAITAGTADEPTLTFTAYAVQYDEQDISTAAAAWAIANS